MYSELAECFRNLGWSSLIEAGAGLGGEGSVSDWLSPELAPDSTRLAARDNTSRGDSGSYAGSAVDITIPT